MRFKSKNPPTFFKEKNPKNIDIFKCKYCGQLCGCTPEGNVGMYAYKILRIHEENCSKNNTKKYKEFA